jgi:hypothetical protein
MKNYKEWLNESYDDVEITYDSSGYKFGYQLETNDVYVRFFAFGKTDKNYSVVYSGIPQEVIDVIEDEFKDSYGINFFINWHFPNTSYGEKVINNLEKIKFSTVLVTSENGREYENVEKLIKADEKSFRGLFYIYYNDESERHCFLDTEALIFMINNNYLPLEFAQVIYKNSTVGGEDLKAIEELLHVNRGKIVGKKFGL